MKFRIARPKIPSKQLSLEKELKIAEQELIKLGYVRDIQDNEKIGYIRDFKRIDFIFKCKQAFIFALRVEDSLMGIDYREAKAIKRMLKFMLNNW